MLINVTVRGDLTTFGTAAFVARLAGVLGVPSGDVELLSITAARNHNRRIHQATRAAALAASRALHSLMPSEGPSDLSDELRAMERSAAAAAAISEGPNRLSLRLSALVPRSSFAPGGPASPLSKSREALRELLGVELLAPVAFYRPSTRQGTGGGGGD
jgi:hypothetical protein